jgi:hypothetical protein
VVVRDRNLTTLDVNEVMARCNQIKQNILKSLGREPNR